jgi:hypothetical protein
LPDLVCDTSPIQYLHQLGLLDVLHELGERVILPTAVADELSVGRSLGVRLPDVETLDWVTIKRPRSEAALPLISDLGPGEAEALMLALEMPGCVVVLDDAAARRTAEALNLRLTGTLGLLLDAKEAGLIAEIRPMLDRLDDLRFRLAPHTYQAVLRLAGEME